MLKPGQATRMLLLTHRQHFSRRNNNNHIIIRNCQSPGSRSAISDPDCNNNNTKTILLELELEQNSVNNNNWEALQEPSQAKRRNSIFLALRNYYTKCIYIEVRHHSTVTTYIDTTNNNDNTNINVFKKRMKKRVDWNGNTQQQQHQHSFLSFSNFHSVHPWEFLVPFARSRSFKWEEANRSFSPLFSFHSYVYVYHQLPFCQQCTNTTASASASGIQVEWVVERSEQEILWNGAPGESNVSLQQNGNNNNNQ